MNHHYPNPDEKHVTISYTIDAFMSVKLILSDFQGRIRSTIIDEIKQPGNYQVTFPINNLPAGQYTYTLYKGSDNSSNTLIIN